MAFDQAGYDATRDLVIRLTAQHDDLKAKKKELDEMYRNMFDNDEGLQNMSEQLKSWQTQVTARKTAIKQSDEAKDLLVKLDGLREDLKLVKESLSVHLLSLYQMTNSTSFDVSPTEEREYTVRAQVKGQAKKKKNAPAVGQMDVFGGEVTE